MFLSRSAAIFGLICGAAFLSGCVLSSEGNGSQWIGKSASALVAAQGAPSQEFASPAGVTIYVYRQRSSNGQNVLCHYDYFVRGGVVVGYQAHGEAINCSGRAGESG